MLGSRKLGASIALALAFAPGVAWADGADALFDQGLARMESGDYEHGCPKIAESYSLDPRPGVLFTLAECEARRGRLATAVRRYGDYLTLHASLPLDAKKKQGKRDKAAREQVAKLRPLVPELTLILHPNAPRGTLVWRDGVPVPADDLGMAIRLDPGPHQVSLQGPRAPVTQMKVTLERGDKKVLRLLPAPPRTPAVDPPLVPPDHAQAPSGASGQRIAGWVTGSLGVAALVVGAIAGGMAVAKKSAVDDNCGVGGVPAACNHTGKVAADSLKTLGLVSTIGISAGVGAVGVGVVLLATAPKEKAVALGLRGAF